MVHTSGSPESRHKGKHKIPDSVFERVHEPVDKTEKERFKLMMDKVYSAEALYRKGMITKQVRDEGIEEAEEEYDSR